MMIMSPNNGQLNKCIKPFLNETVFCVRLRFVCVCRCEISKNLCCRNLAVEKAVSELPTDCTFCLKQFPRSSLERHQTEECQDRYSPQKGRFLLPVCNVLNVPRGVMEFKES